MTGQDTSGVGGPSLVRPFERENSKPVWRDRRTVAAVGGSHAILGTLTCEDALCAHDTRNAVASSRTAKHLSQPRAAIGLTTADKGFSNALAQLHVLHLSRSWFAVPLFPVVVAAARDQQCFT